MLQVSVVHSFFAHDASSETAYVGAGRIVCCWRCPAVLAVLCKAKEHLLELSVQQRQLLLVNAVLDRGDCLRRDLQALTTAQSTRHT
jgi:hypothetical protein